MCGIAGELRFTKQVEPKADWEAISAMMARRGPDDAGMWSDGDGCTLVFRRLAIIDLSVNGHQPMTVGNDRYVLVFNGEVYNFLELRKALENQGVRFRSTSDSEVVLHALIEWGIKALERFNGMFALGFYDSVEKRLLLSRDHAGMKPLYYLIDPKGIVFASQYDQLLMHPLSRNLKISQDALGLYLRLAYIPAPYGLYQGTHMVEPGTWIQITGNGIIEKGSYFQFPRYEVSTLKGDQALEAVNAAIEAAVKRHLISDVPVGAFLSGGIDSPLVVAKMRAVSTSAIQAFTIGTDEATTDESEDASMYARQIGVAHTLEHVTPDKTLDLLDKVINACGEPFGDYSMFPTMIVSYLASQNFKVMLSGDGGDELFWGYPDRFGSLLKMSSDFRLPYWWRSLRGGIRGLLRGSQQDRSRPSRALGDCHRAMLTHLPEMWLKRIFPSLPAWPEAYTAFAYNSQDQDSTAQWSRWSEFVSHLPYVLMKVDRASMYHSLEVRVPLLDREVIEVAARVDWRECLDINRMVGKLPLRRALARHTNYQSRAKRGFEVPMASWLRTSLREKFEESILHRNEILGLEIDRKALRELFELHLSGRRNFAWGLWPLLSLGLWMETHHHSSREF